MKFILFDNFRFADNHVSKPVSFSIIPDTAIFRDNLYFIPREDFDLYGTLCLFLKVSRVGKHISDKFAFKYVDQFGFAVQTYFPQIIEECIKQNINSAPGYSFDNALWISESSGNLDLSTPYPIAFDFKVDLGITKNEITVSQLKNISALVSEASKIFTIKVGDILLFPIVKIAAPFVKGNKISINNSEKELLYISIN